MKSSELEDHDSSIASFHERLLAGEVSCEETVGRELKNIHGYAKKHNAFVTVFDGAKGLALSRARILDQRLSRGDRSSRSPLFGVPLTVKDNTFIGGFPTTNGSQAFRDFVPATNAELVDQLLGVGCVPLGKTNLQELALGIMGTSALDGPMHNPVDPDRVSGGSSGGAAISVALSEGPILATGSDTGGSVRVPAALCGVCGFKPSHGLLSAEGVFPLSGTLDHMGIFAKSVPDLALGFRALTGRTRTSSRSKHTVGIPSSYFVDDMDAHVSKDFWTSIDALKATGDFRVKDVKVEDDFARYSQARAIIMLREGAWFYESLLGSPATRKLMHADVLTLLDRGAKFETLRYMRSLGLIYTAIRSTMRLFRDVDLLAMPSSLVVAPRIADVLGKETGPVRTLMLRNAELFNLTGLPGLSLPMQRKGRLPTGMQIVGRAGEDDRVLAAAESAWTALRGSVSH